jgi:adenylate cyclase
LDGDAADLFALQDEVTSRIAVALNLELIAAEVVRPTEHPDALDYILRGRAASYKPNSPEKWTEAISLFEHALALDPQSVDARCWLAIMLVNRVLSAMSHTAATDIARADAMTRQASAGSPRNPRLHLAKGEVLRTQGRPEEAIPEYETVLAFDRNSRWALFGLGHCKLMTGSMDEGISLLEKVIRLSPRDPIIAGFYTRIGTTHLLQSRIDQAIVWLEKARNANPIHSAPHAYLASAYAIKGYNERAFAEFAEARRLSGDDRYSSLSRLREVGYWGVPKVRALYEATFFVGLRKAGMPEE